MFPVVMFPLSRISQSRAFKLLTLLRGGDSLKSLQRLSQSPHNPCRSSFEGLSRLRFLETLKLRLFPVTETNILFLAWDIKVYDIQVFCLLIYFLQSQVWILVKKYEKTFISLQLMYSLKVLSSKTSFKLRLHEDIRSNICDIPYTYNVLDNKENNVHRSH